MADSGVNFEKKRTKEQLIAAQREAWGTTEREAARRLSGLDATLASLSRGETTISLAYLASEAGSRWALATLRDFDLRRVDERGFLLEAGDVKWRPRQEGVPGSETVVWTAGEHLDDVLAMGAKLVTARARAALGKTPVPTFGTPR